MINGFTPNDGFSGRARNRGLADALRQLGQQLSWQAQNDQEYERRQKTLIDDRLFQQGLMDDREAAQRRNMGAEYGLRERLARVENPTIHLPVIGDTGITTSGLAEFMRSMAYQQDVQQRANKPATPQRDYLGEKIALEEWKKNNLPQDPQKPVPPPVSLIPVMINGQQVMVTPDEAARLGIKHDNYYAPEEVDGPNWLQRLLGIGGGQPSAQAPRIMIDPATGEPIGG